MPLDLYVHLVENRLVEVADRLDAAARAAGVYPLCTSGLQAVMKEDGQVAGGQQIRDLKVVPPAGFEPATPGLGVRRSIP